MGNTSKSIVSFLIVTSHTDQTPHNGSVVPLLDERRGVKSTASCTEGRTMSPALAHPALHSVENLSSVEEGIHGTSNKRLIRRRWTSHHFSSYSCHQGPST